MASAKHEYQHFIRWLHRPNGEVSEDVRRFGRLVLDNFNSVSTKTHHRSKRSAHLVSLARQQFSTNSAELPQLDSIAAATEWKWQRLSYLSLGPFRGFRRIEEFDLT